VRCWCARRAISTDHDPQVVVVEREAFPTVSQAPSVHQTCMPLDHDVKLAYRLFHALVRAA
jgi:hypothetical protein